MFRVFGPPGTGKTTTLLNLVDRALDEGVDPNKIGFFAFTRKAANEARERACTRFGFDLENDLPYFRTLHSFAYRALGVRERDMISREHYRQFAEATGFEMSTTMSSPDSETVVSKRDHPILSLIQLARLKKNDLRREYDLSNINHTWVEVDYVARSYQNFKEANALMDFTDLLELFVREADKLIPEFDLCVLDEAQDLSNLQWDIAHQLDKRSKKMYCAGDDDQAIYTWAGANVDQFISLPGGVEVLDQSYRVPSLIHKLAEGIATQIRNRFPKVYKPREKSGEIIRLHDVREIDMSHGSWLVMSQANHMLHPVAEELKSNGYLFEYKGARSISDRLSHAINGWEQMRNGKAITPHAARAIYSYMTGNGVRVKRGYKTIDCEDDDLLTLEQLQEEFGLLATKDMIWHEAMDKMPNLDRAYITALLRRGEKFNAMPRIRLSTIHGTKGGEAENVVVITDLTMSAMDSPSDDLHRLFYVAVTRTMERLFIIEPDDYGRAYNL